MEGMTELCAGLLKHQPMSPDDKLLYQKIRGENWDWIEGGDARSVMTRLCTIVILHQEEIDGTCLALVAKRLLKAEVKPGGPYVFDKGEVDIFLNKLIVLFFVRLGIRLKDLEDFISSSHQESTLPHAETEILKLFLGYHKGSNSRVLAKKIEQSPITNKVKIQLKQKYHKSLIYQDALNTHRGVAKADKNFEVSLLSDYFSQSLKPKYSSTDAKVIENYNTGNFYTWMAYTIYDDFFDSHPRAELLALANIFHRESLNHYIYATDDANYRYINEFFMKTDLGIYEEVHKRRCDITKGIITIQSELYKTSLHAVCYKSYAHILGPYLVALSSGMNVEQIRLIEKGLSHYLVARQLNDDIHDWAEDLENGHVSYIVAYMLRRCDIVSGTYDLQDLKKQLKVYFWRQGLMEVCQFVLNEIEAARHCLEATEAIVGDSIFFKKVLYPIEKSAWGGITNYSDYRSFIKQYSVV